MTDQDKPYELNSPWAGCLGWGVVALLVMFFPVFLAFANTAPGANIFSEGDPNSGGAAIWLMMFTIPAAFFIVIAAIARALRKSREQKNQSYGSPDFPDMM